MADGNGKRKRAWNNPLAKELVLCIVVFIVLAFILFQATSTFTMTLIFNDRMDESQAVNLKCSFNALHFETKDLTSNITGGSAVLLNTTFQGQEYLLYSENFTSNEIEKIGTFEKEGKVFLVLWPSEATEGKEYVVGGEFTHFYEFGTIKTVPVLLVKSYHEVSVIDQILSTNKALFSHIVIGLIALTATTILILVGSILIIGAQISEKAG